ncbi:MAG: antitoxin Xre/MbcA/ParS toxin-binding domain-containing protein [Vibrio sp.]|uniref:type II RES/Xre toxin-antitoxin system antitoxin n=1 Tax=Vibrio sp. TaxID=678 RepID=UPI003A8C84BB
MPTAVFRPQKTKQRHGYLASMNLIENASKSIMDGIPASSLLHLMEGAKVSVTTVHRATKIPLSTLKRRVKEDQNFTTLESDAIYRLAALLDQATELFENEDKARQWLETPVYGLGGKRPIDMTSTTVDFERVQDLIGRIEHGVYS